MHLRYAVCIFSFDRVVSDLVQRVQDLTALKIPGIQAALECKGGGDL
jgi:hypothetical protein